MSIREGGGEGRRDWGGSNKDKAKDIKRVDVFLGYGLKKGIFA